MKSMFGAFRAAIAAMLLICGCGESPRPAASPAPASAEAPAAIPVTTVARGTVGRIVQLPAEVRPWQEVVLHSKVPGYVRSIAVDRGDRVREGSIVAELEAPELAADVAKARADLTLASTLSGRVGRAHSKAPDLVVAQSVDEAQAKMQVARAALERAETMLSFATIRASFDGVVTERFVDPGAFVPAATAAAAAQTAAIVAISDFHKVRIHVAVPEAEAAFVREGTPAEVRVEEAGDRRAAASVTRISYALERATRAMTAEVDLDNSDSRLRPGMLAHVRLTVEEHKDVLSVPSDAVVTDKSGAAMFAVDEAGRLHRTSVKTGFADGARTEILDGVAEGQRVAIAGKRTLRDGQVVLSESAK